MREKESERERGKVRQMRKGEKGGCRTQLRTGIQTNQVRVGNQWETGGCKQTITHKEVEPKF